MQPKILVLLCIFFVALFVGPALADQYAGASITNSKDSTALSVNEQGGTIENNGLQQNTYNGAETNIQTVSLTFPSGTINVPLNFVDTDAAISTLYQNQVINIPLGELAAGYGANISWKSSEPILVYVTDNSTVNSAVHDIAAAPVYDDIFGTFNHGEIAVYKQNTFFASTINDGLSRHNWGVFVSTADKNYDLIIDTRAAEHRNTQINTGSIEDNSFDVAYDVSVGGYYPQAVVTPSVVGTVSQYPIDSTTGLAIIN